MTTANEKKTGKRHEPEAAGPQFSVYDSLPTMEAKAKYDDYLKEYARKLRQLQRIASGEMSPSDEWYTDDGV